MHGLDGGEDGPLETKIMKMAGNRPSEACSLAGEVLSENLGRFVGEEFLVWRRR